MGLFSRRDGQQNEPKSLEGIQQSLNYYGNYNGNGNITDQVDRLRDQLERMGYEAEYQCGYNTYEIKPIENPVSCTSCGYSHIAPACD